LRARLTLLVVLPAVLVAVLMIHGAIEAREQAAHSARQELAALSEFASLHLDRVVRATKQQLGTLADVPAVNRLQEPGCSAVLAALKSRTERYANIVVMGLDGGMR
jgi:hypothetical protein